MGDIQVNGTRLHYVIEGDGPETVVFSHGLLMNSEMYRPQIDALKHEYRCIAYDHRGQGQSEVSPNGYDMDNVALDAAELIRKLDLAPCHFIGLSMGGFVGMRLAIHHPELLRSLVLLDTSADPESTGKKHSYRLLAFIGRWFGFSLVADKVMNILFGRTFMNDPHRDEERRAWKQYIVNSDRVGTIRAATGVIDRKGVFDQLAQIRTPTLVIVGEEDIGTPPENSQRIRAAISGARLVTVPAAGHSPTIEQPDAVNLAIASFLSQLRAPA